MLKDLSIILCKICAAEASGNISACLPCFERKHIYCLQNKFVYYFKSHVNAAAYIPLILLRNEKNLKRVWKTVVKKDTTVHLSDFQERKLSTFSVECIVRIVASDFFTKKFAEGFSFTNKVSTTSIRVIDSPNKWIDFHQECLALFL